MCQDLVPPPSGPDEAAGAGAELPSWARVSQHWLGNVKVRRTGSGGGGGGDDDDDDDDDECIGEDYQAELPPFESHPPVSASALDALSVRALKEQIRERGLDASDCVEKRELVELLVANSPPLAADAGVRGGVRLDGDDVEVAIARATAARLTAAAFGRDAERAARVLARRRRPPRVAAAAAAAGGGWRGPRRRADVGELRAFRRGRTFGNMGAKAVHMRSGVCGGGGERDGGGGGDGGGAAAGAKRKAAGDNHRVYDATGEPPLPAVLAQAAHLRQGQATHAHDSTAAPPPAEPRAPPAPAHRPQPRRPSRARNRRARLAVRLPPWSGELAGAVPESARRGVANAPLAGWARVGMRRAPPTTASSGGGCRRRRRRRRSQRQRGGRRRSQEQAGGVPSLSGCSRGATGRAAVSSTLCGGRATARRTTRGRTSRTSTRPPSATSRTARRGRAAGLRPRA